MSKPKNPESSSPTDEPEPEPRDDAEEHDGDDESDDDESDDDDSDEEDEDEEDEDEEDEDEQDPDGEDDDDSSRDSDEEAARPSTPKPKVDVAAAMARADKGARPGAPQGESTIRPSQLVLAVIVAAIAGGVVGWSARGSGGADAGGRHAPTAPSRAAAAASGSAGSTLPVPCQQWTERICKGAGEDSEGCGEAKAAVTILPASACETALGEVDATLASLKQARGVCDDLVSKLCKDLGAETQSCSMVREKTGEMPTARCRQLLDNYADVLAELQAMEKRNAPIAPEAIAKLASGDPPAFGPKDAKVTVVEFSDFQCPYCSEAAKTVTRIKKRYGKLVRFVFRNYPLSFHQQAFGAAEAALAAHAQGKFWGMHDLLFDNQKDLGREQLEQHAKKLGLDDVAFRKALDDRSQKAAVEQDLELAKEIAVEGTPTLIVGSKRIDDPRDFDAISAVIDEQLTAAGVTPPAAATAAPKAD